MGYYLVFGLLSIGLGAVLFLLLYGSTTWHPYLAWLAAWWVTTFVVYGLDKGLAKARGPRVPELILNLLAVVGGFGGAWLGMLVFRHKSNVRRHLTIWVILVLSTVGHAVLIYYWLLK
jgi:uncharacterized membrane protein YsdA (DUF1294 family)